MTKDTETKPSAEETALANIVIDIVTSIEKNTKKFSKEEGRNVVDTAFIFSICAYMAYLGIEPQGESINNYIFKLNQGILKTYPEIKKALDERGTDQPTTPVSTLETTLRLSKLVK